MYYLLELQEVETGWGYLWVAIWSITIDSASGNSGESFCRLTPECDLRDITGGRAGKAMILID